MRKILLGTAAILATSTVLFSSIDAQAAVTSITALTATSADYDLTTVFGPKMTAAGVKAYVTALAQEPAAGTPGIKGFNTSPAATGVTADGGVSAPKTLDAIANKIGAVTSWNVLNANAFTTRISLVSGPMSTFSATQWLQVKMKGCAVGSFSRAHVQSTQDPSLYTATDTFNALTSSTVAYQTYDTALEAVEAAAALKDTTFFTSVIPAAIDSSIAGNGGTVGSSAAVWSASPGVSAATFNIYIKPTVAAFSPSITPVVQYLEYVVSCFGVYQTYTP